MGYDTKNGVCGYEFRAMAYSAKVFLAWLVFK